MRITEPVTGIYKIEVPFEDIYTAVFAVRTQRGFLLIDCATTVSDVDDRILPALREIGLGDRAPEALLLTHGHGDHAGGSKRLTEHFPAMPVLALEQLKNTANRRLLDKEIVAGCLQVIHLPGHTAHSVGYLHLKTNTLISGDCLQQRGVSKYVNGIKFPAFYLASIQRLRGMRLACILASHDYVPLGSMAVGEEEIARYLDECLAACPAR